MISSSNYLIRFMACLFLAIFNIAIINSAFAEANMSAGKIQGKVSEIINVKGYTYAEVDTGSKKVWAAGPTTALKKGDTVSFSTTMLMKDFHSASMDRSFALIYFISRFNTAADKISSSVKPPADAQVQQMRDALSGIKKVKGGNNIAEIHAEKDKLNGKTIRVRGQVTRFSAEIMGKNWLHIQDSSSFDDLTITTDKVVAVGDVVVIEGKLELDKDFDYGYIFALIVQDAKVSKE